MNISTENLAYWYFRLNGFLGLNNFIIHRSITNNEHVTDLDFVGVRFQHRKELLDNAGKYMEDDNLSNLFSQKYRDKIYICLVEAKSSMPSINPTWLDSDNLEQIFYSLGIVNFKRLPKLIERLRNNGFCIYNKYFISFVAVGQNQPQINTRTQNNLIFKIPVITWKEVMDFIYVRFKDYPKVKSNLIEWGNSDGQQLKQTIEQSNTKEDFYNKVTNTQTNRLFVTI